MTTLYGITPTGKVVTRNTKAEYEYGTVSGGELSRCHFSLDAALKFAQPGAVIVALTPARLHGGEASYTVIWDSRTVSYPRCYACDNPGLGRAKRWNGQKYFYVPACKTRHALKEAS